MRKFEIKHAARERVPLLVGFAGPSGGGKTYSALRVATGVQSITGGGIYVIDTEARRALHYSEMFSFEHIDFKAPFGPLDYLAAIEQCVAAGAGVIIIDSMSHEHEGVGGVLEMHDAELDRMAGNDWNKRNAMTMLAWQKPKEQRRQLLNRILQINTSFIFCFRAKSKIKPGRDSEGRSVMVQMGWMPITGDEIAYEMTLYCLLLPRANGVPTWQSEHIGERQMMKLPEQFKKLFEKPKALDENIGVALAQWAAGSRDVRELAREAAGGGSDVFKKFWGGLKPGERTLVLEIEEEIKTLRVAADAEQLARGEVQEEEKLL